MIEIKEIQNEDWGSYKSIRLESLIESPESFGGTFENESQLTDEFWKNRIKSFLEEHNTGLFAIVNGEKVGLVAGIKNNEDSKVLNMYQLWVHPSHRRKKIGNHLIQYLWKWAKNLGYERIELGVTKSNDKAYQFYLTEGYKEFKKDNEECERWMVKNNK